MSALEWLVAGISVAGIVAGVVYWIKGQLRNAVALDERTAALQLQSARLAAEEAAAVAERAARLKEFDAKAASVRTSDDAVALLRSELSRARDSSTAGAVRDSGAASAAGATVTSQPEH